MPYEIETKDGIVIRNIPDNIKPDDPVLKARVANIRFQRNAENPDLAKAGQMAMEGMSGLEKFRAGVGKAISDTGQGLSQLGNMALDTFDPRRSSRADQSRQQVAETRARDAALMESGAGLTGNIAGNIGIALAPGGVLKGASVLARGTQAAPVLSAMGGALLDPRSIAGAAAVGGGFGAIQPTVTEGERLTNTLFGAGAGAAIPMGVRGWQTAKAAVAPFYREGQDQIIGSLLNRAAGADASTVARRLAGARELVPGSIPTAGQASGNAGIAAVERTASAIDPSVTSAYASRMADQNTARVGLLQQVAGTSDDLTGAIAARADATRPIREAALREANYGGTKTAELSGRIAQKNDSIVSALRDAGRFNTFAANQGDLAANNFPVSGMPRVAGRVTDNLDRVSEGLSAASDAVRIEGQRKAERAFLERQLNSLKQAGYQPLTSEQVSSGISSTLNKPGIRASDVVRSTLSEIKQKLADFADSNGVIDARDLYTIRKEIGNTISKHAKESATWDKRLTSSLERDVQLAIDSAIEKAGAGPLWGNYLQTFKNMSGEVNRFKIGQEIADRSVSKLTGSLKPEAFARALTDDTAKAVTGFNQATLAGSMPPNQLQALNSIRDDLARAIASQNAGRGVGSDTVQKLAYSNLIDAAGIPSFLRTFAPLEAAGNIAGRGADALYGRANREMAQRLAELLLDAQQSGNVMLRSNAPPGLLGTNARRIGQPLFLSAPGLLNAQKE